MLQSSSSPYRDGRGPGRWCCGCCGKITTAVPPWGWLGWYRHTTVLARYGWPPWQGAGDGDRRSRLLRSCAFREGTREPASRALIADLIRHQ